ncbi:precorrin-3B synthase [Jatrophihabitans endophyticus]|uniref:Precorrin-3B synthase n=1 Tax=Jatrophihabitans endophyticus TaxID=1206085 RepID=A0A1M5Q599_9ACTN|nr:hypothetical protein [Jatrophihabitans endophyticus]SHH09427.1 precorrin-3B synthase [Jatrophihabitans endophyticus]
MPPTPPTLAADRCPGLLRLIEAADGLLARVRLPGGRLGAAELHALADATDAVGDGRLELTSRGNVQVRGMTAAGADELARRMTAAGLLPVPARDLVRNVLASPLAGLTAPPERTAPLDLTAHVRALDDRLRHDPGLDGLSGRFLFGLDDGRGDIAGLAPDVLRVVGAGDRPDEVARGMVDEARTFLAGAGGAWRRPAAERRHDGVVRARSGPPPLGRVARLDGGVALVVAPPLGRLTSAQARWLGAHAPRVRVTPWRSVVIPQPTAGADPGDAGLVTDPASPWRLVSACAGRPRCAKAHADVQADAAGGLRAHPGRRVHWVGCERACGRTSDVEVTMVATGTGYRTEAVHG